MSPATRAYALELALTSPLVLFNLHPRPLCSYACLNMELRELKPPVFTSRRVT